MAPLPTALIVLDGVGDRPGAPEAFRALERARTPQLDRLSGLGQVGAVSVVGPGVAPESDAGVFALLGYDPVQDSPGRGVLEALGIELPLRPGDVALRLNFATLAPDRRVVDPRVGRSLSTAEASELAGALSRADLLADEGIRAEVRSTVGHRGVLWLRPNDGKSLSPEISNADPFYEKVGGMGQARTASDARLRTVEPLDGTPAAARTARAVNTLLERIRPILADHPVNDDRRGRAAPEATGLLVRNAGALPRTPVEPFAHRYGRSGAALTEMPVERGIAKLLGLADRYVGPMPADRDAGYRERARQARELLASSPFLYVHLKGPDEPGHDGDAERKRAVVEEIDRAFFAPFLDGLDLERVRVAVTADHATPPDRHGHSDDPVPWVLAGAGIRPTGPGAPRKYGGASQMAEAPFPGSQVLPRLFASDPASARR